MTQIRLSRFSRAAERDGAERFRLVAFAVAEKSPEFRLFLPVHQPARLQVAIEPRLIQRQDRAKAHRDRRELPEIRHQIRMRIRRQPAAFGEFLPEISQMPFVQPAFEKRPRIHARARRALENKQCRRENFPCARGKNG